MKYKELNISVRNARGYSRLTFPIRTANFFDEQPSTRDFVAATRALYFIFILRLMRFNPYLWNR